MESRFFDILTKGINTGVAVEGMTAETSVSTESVVKLPGVIEKLIDIETLLYAGATEAMSVAITDLERYIKLLALESYNKISIDAMESRIEKYPDEVLKLINARSTATTIGYALRLIEPIHNEIADCTREALEGYLRLMYKGANLDVKDTMHSITNTLHVVFESVIDANFEEIEYDVTDVVGMESAISLAIEDIRSDVPETDIIATMYEICESIYDSACENLIRLEGTDTTLFDIAMEVMLGRKQYEENNKVEDMKKRITAVKSDAKKYVSELRKMQLDLDIERSRNNNLRISRRLERKVNRKRYSVNDDITFIEDKIKELNDLDYKKSEDRGKIEEIIKTIRARYDRAIDKVEKSQSKENDIIKGAKDRQLRAASRGSVGERALNRLGGALKSGAGKVGTMVDNMNDKTHRKIERDLAEGRITNEEADKKYRQIAKRGRKFKNKISSMADNASEKITVRTDKMKAERDKIIAAGGKYYRDKNLVEKDIAEANKRAKHELKNEADKKPKMEKKATAHTEPDNVGEKSEATSDSSKTRKTRKLVDPKDESLFVENWSSLTPDQQKTIKKLRSDYVKAYNAANNASRTDDDYITIKKTYDMRLKLLRDKIEEFSNPPVEKPGSSTDNNQKRPRKKGKSKLRDRLSEEDRVNYDRILNTMTQLSNRKHALEQKKNRTQEEDDKIAELGDKLEKARAKYNSFIRYHQGTESIAENLFEKIDTLQYAMNAGYSVYDMSEMTDEAFEAFIESVEENIYNDCFIVAMEAAREKESRKEEKARKAAKKEAERKAKEEAMRQEREDARNKVIEYANERIDSINTLRTNIGEKWHTYSNDIKNLTDRAESGNLRGLRHARLRNVVKNSVGGSKYDFKKYNELISDLADTEKELKKFISSKEFYDEYDKTDKPTKDYKVAIKKINKMVKKLVEKATKKEKEIEKIGQVLDSNSVVQHERNDKEAYRKKQQEEAQKKDRKNNPDKYKLQETKSEYERYLREREALEKKYAADRASFSTLSPSAIESMELPTYVESIDEFDVDVSCMLLDLRDSLIDPDLFFENPIDSDASY